MRGGGGELWIFAGNVNRYHLPLIVENYCLYQFDQHMVPVPSERSCSLSLSAVRKIELLV